MKISDRILSLLLFSVETTTSPQDHRPSSRVTGVGGETDVSSMTALGADNLAVFCADDAVSDVVESGVHWRSDFQIGSRVLKICFKPILMHIYGMQYDFMHRSC